MGGWKRGCKEERKRGCKEGRKGGRKGRGAHIPNGHLACRQPAPAELTWERTPGRPTVEPLQMSSTPWYSPRVHS